MFQSPVRAIWASGRSASHRCPRGAQRVEPGDLVVEVRITERTSVGDVERPDLDAVAGSPEGTSFRSRRVAPLRHAVKALPDVGQPDPRGDRHAIPLVVAERRHVVAERLETHHRPLVVASLGLLDRQHVDLVPLDQSLDPTDPGPDRVDVEGGDAHEHLSQVGGWPL